MRITGGKARGIPLRTTRFGGFRPAMDSLRQSLFSSLSSRASLDGARVLDLFSGSGGYGLEALSRGAGSVTMVERDRRALACLRHNLEAVRRSSEELAGVPVEIVGRGVEHFSALPASFDLILCDPPYEQGGHLMDGLWEHLREWLDPESDWGLIWETVGENRKMVPAGWRELRVIGGARNQPTLLWLVPETDGSGDVVDNPEQD